MEKKQTHLIYGLITGIVSVIIGLIVYLTGQAFKPGMQYISVIPFLAGIILNAIAYSKANDGAVTFGNVFGSGFKASVVVMVIFLVYSIISLYAFPDIKEKTLEIARESMAKNPKMTDETMDTAMAMTMKLWGVFYIGGAIVGSLIYGAIFSLIGGAIAKKNAVRPAGDNF